MSTPDVMPPGLYNMDCMAAMATFPDKFFDLAVVDPPYGGGYRNGEAEILRGGTAWEQRRRGRFGGWFDRYHIGPHYQGDADGRLMVEKIPGTKKGDGVDIRHWDIAPPPEYFRELARVSVNQIIWGGNYFALPPTRCFIVWEKGNISENFSMAMCEYAWTSINDNAKSVTIPPQGTAQESRFHPTQKPVRLYSWLLGRYAKPGYKILDTHAGSASSLIACHRAGLAAWGYEIDPEYYAMASARLAREKAQVSLFDTSEPPKPTQINIFDKGEEDHES